MMKCRNHPNEEGVGVCASCLRERLLALIAIQSGSPRRTPMQHGAAAARPSQQLQQQKHTPPPSQLMFPRSVSPYVSRRLPVDLECFPDTDGRCRRRQPIRFYSTPQVGPTAGTRKASGAGFSIFSLLFRSRDGHHFRSEDTEQNDGASGAAARPTSWFAALIPVWGKKKKNKDSPHLATETAAVEDGLRRRRKRRAWCRNRGMSPAGDESGSQYGSESGSGYSTESPNEWRRPAPTPLRKPAPSAQRTMPGFVVCLSPLVRASPRRSHVGEGSGAAALSGEQRGAMGLGGQCRRRHHHRHSSGGGGPPSLGPNRSKKLADFGRFR